MLAGLDTLVNSPDVEFRKAFLDAKRLDEKAMNARAAQLTDSILAFNPDVLIVSDDNAVQSVVVPGLASFKFPVVFCGVNWTAGKYHLASDKVTGMLEVLPVKSCIDFLRSSGRALDTITIISENSTAELKNREALEPRLKEWGLSVKYFMVDSVDEWKEKFIQAQQSSDVVFLPTNGAVRGWDRQEMIDFVKKSIRTPVFTCDDFMMAYACFGFTKVTSEQTRYAASAALALLGGKAVQDIGIVENNEFDFWINRSLSGQVNIDLTGTDLPMVKEYSYD